MNVIFLEKEAFHFNSQIALFSTKVCLQTVSYNHVIVTLALKLNPSPESDSFHVPDIFRISRS